MILNYQNYNKQKYQVVIIGSGPAGISLALGLEKKGIHSLIFRIEDNVNKYSVDLLSRNTKVDLNKDLLNNLKEINGVNLLIK